MPAGSIVQTARVPCHRVRLACTERMAVGDVERAYHKRLNHRPDDAWPPPVGHWEEDPEGGKRFVILDGRHAYIAALMLGDREILVAWVEGG